LSKSNKDFKIPPVSTLIGSTLPNFFRVLIMGNPEIRFYPKLLLTLLVIIISSPFQLFEYFYFRNKVRKFKFKKPPVFIIGHWRSGTTHLHNLLCQDPNHGYLTTYQSVFPNNMMSKWLFKTFMRINIPETRPADNVKLSPDYPQEEEFALANMTTASFYHFFIFLLSLICCIKSLSGLIHWAIGRSKAFRKSTRSSLPKLRSIQKRIG
jgi:hypothetical protein